MLEGLCGINEVLGEEFLKLGFDVTCFTGYPNYPTGKIFPSYNRKINFSETINNVTVRRFPSFIYHGKNKVRRVLNYTSLLISKIIIGTFYIKKYWKDCLTEIDDKIKNKVTYMGAII